MYEIDIGNFTIGKKSPLALICGPCVIESEDQALFAAHFLKNLCDKLRIPLIYKSSYDKANRSSVQSFRGPGMDQGLLILERVKKEFQIPVVTDIHTPDEAMAASQVCEVLQIPAFLCRQTDLVVAAGQTGKVVKVKKGQFMAPWDMKNVIEKIESTGNKKILLTDRGTTFGYNNLVSDMRSIPIMQGLGYPVCYDATHSVQLPAGNGSSSGGQREFVETLAKAAIAAGANCIYLEAHPNPLEAKCDKENQIPFDQLEELLRKFLRIAEAVRPEEVTYV
ncbi:MAG: 2-dehydro-3-deoxyphosphooctonate aldolase [Chlamydiae bacterium]|nr:2-dehydro-3-deoxyphosphooctonate aldolase [Chlamydiota bacterium]